MKSTLVADSDVGCGVIRSDWPLQLHRREGIMAIALFENRPRHVEEMKGFEPMYDATLRECLQRPFYLFARGRGRSCRKEIWVFSLFIAFINSCLTGICGRGSLAFIPLVFSLVMLVPQYALEVRRLHDLSLSGWLALVPYGLMAIATVVIVGSGLSADGGGLDSASSSPLVIIPMLLAIVIQLVIMCVPSRHHRPSVNNRAIGAGMN